MRALERRESVRTEPGSPSDADCWVRDSALLDQALELDAAQRPAWLAQLRADDPEAAERLASLLASDAAAEASGFLQQALDLPATAQAAPEPVTGMVCGAYRLYEQIGSGGMGTVWRGERADGHFQRNVAIKLLHADAVSPAWRQRLQHEAALLARLAHPHIAALIDAGIADTGQPYLVLEYVAGRRIDEACAALALPLARRLALLLEVLSAVAHAHRHLVLHLDLKPANVLLTDLGQEVKLLDFGVATLLEGDANARTRSAPAVGWTPRYAAPEQLRGDAVTTAADVYALGRLMQELVKPCKASVEARRDLDAIVACATATEPADRYPTAMALADDIQRHLRHEPVRARQAGWRYAAGRYLRRHARAVSVTVLAVLALLILTAVAVWQRNEAQAQRDAALQRQRDAEAVRDFASRTLALGGTDGRSLGLEQRVDLAEAMARRLYGTQPAVLAELLMMVGSQNTVLQRRPARERNFADAAALASRSGDPGLMARAACAAVPMDAPDAGPRVAALAMAMPLADPRYTRARQHCHAFAATLLAWQGQVEAAQRHAAASEVALAELGPLRALLQADMHETRGDVARAAGDLAQAEAHYAASLEADTWASGAEVAHLYTATRLNYRMLMHLQIGLPQKALALSDDLLELYAGMSNGTQVPAYVMSNRGGALLMLGRHAQAKAALHEAVRRGEQTGSTRYRLGAQVRLADLLVQVGRLDEARDLLDAIVREPLSRETAWTRAVVALGQGQWHLAVGAPQAAEAAAAEAALAVAGNSFLRPLQWQAEMLQAQALLAAGRPAEATQAARRALASSRALAGPYAARGTVHTARAGVLLARAMQHSDPSAARRELAQAAPVLQRALGAEHADAAAARALAEALDALLKQTPTKAR